jgi:ribonuclease HI
VPESPEPIGVCGASTDIWHVFTDGAARGNPGPAGAGLVIMRGDHPEEKLGVYLGKKTNNQAEYLALLLALWRCAQSAHRGDKPKEIVVHADSELLVRQLSGIYKVRDEILKRIHQCIFLLIQQEQWSVTFVHVMREQNKIADAMANEGIDKKRAMPPEFVNALVQWNCLLL